MASYPPMTPTNGANFTSTIRNDTYPFIANSNHAGHVVFVTGASRGIGKAIALSFARAGAAFIGIGDISSFGDIEAEIHCAAQEAGQSPPKVLCLQLDVTNSASVAYAAAELRKHTPRLDILINNAGFMTPAFPVVEADEDLWWRTFEVNLKGVFLMCKHFTPLLLSTMDGLKTVINLNSVAAHNLRPDASAYGTSKVAVLKFTEFLLVEQAKEGLIAYSVHPGGIMTKLAEDGMPKETLSALTDTPQLTGDTIAFLTQERRAWLSGRYLSCTWDMQELLEKMNEIVRDDKLKVRLIL